MQRFGTASVPTHSIGLALLQSDWQKAVKLILQPRPGEHPDVEAGRRAWLEEHNVDKALQLLPRRVVAERCILEQFKKQGGDGRNCMSALSTVSALHPIRVCPGDEHPLPRSPATCARCMYTRTSRTYGIALCHSVCVSSALSTQSPETWCMQLFRVNARLRIEMRPWR